MMINYISTVSLALNLVSMSFSMETDISLGVGGAVWKQTMFTVQRGMCSTDSPTELRNNIRSRSECIRSCLGTNGCTSVNWKMPSTCEMFLSSHPANFANISDCTFLSKGEDCSHFRGSDGLRAIDMSGQLVNVYCDLTTPGGGWLVFQRRTDGSVDFFRDWISYENGFGDKSTEFWLGLRLIYQLTSARTYKLRIDIEDSKGNSSYAEYSSFSIGSPATNYVLNVGTYTGDAGDCFSNIPDMYVPLVPGFAQGMPFSTYDADHDTYPGNCAVILSGAWWYNSCACGNLNGLYQGGKHAAMTNGLYWDMWTRGQTPIKFTEMKIAAIH